MRCVAWAPEVGDSGTPHLQGFVVYKNAGSLDRTRKDFPGCHVEVMKSKIASNVTYCSKQSELVILGDLPKQPNHGAEATKARWKHIMSLVKAHDYEALEDQYPKEWLLHHQSWFNWQTYKKCAPVSMGPNYWVWGPPGTGKTQQIQDYCRMTGQGYFQKSKDDDWCGYNGEEWVHIDEFEPCDQYGKYDWKAKSIKVWAHSSPFPARIKFGKPRSLNPPHIYVSAQQNIDDTFPAHISPSFENLNKAVHRRFLEIHMERPLLDYPPNISSTELCPVEDWPKYGYVPKPFTPRPLTVTEALMTVKKSKPTKRSYDHPSSSLVLGKDHPDKSCPPMKLVKRTVKHNE